MSLSGTAVVILGLLDLRPRSGYEIKRTVDRSTRYFWSASYGQIYPELRRLAKAGLIAGEDAPTGAAAENRIPDHGAAPRRVPGVARRSRLRPRTAGRGPAEALLRGSPVVGAGTRARPRASRGAPALARAVARNRRRAAIRRRPGVPGCRPRVRNRFQRMGGLLVGGDGAAADRSRGVGA
jgi:hypothetical protein